MTEEMRSRVLGAMMACVSRGVFLQPNAEPVAFLYGRAPKEGETPTHTIDSVDYVGVVLPPLPEWDTEAYPYALISAAYWAHKQLFCFASAPVGTKGGGVSALTEPISYLWYNWTAGEWTEGVAEIGSQFGAPYWTNWGVLCEDESLYMEKSPDPIPIYE